MQAISTAIFLPQERLSISVELTRSRSKITQQKKVQAYVSYVDRQPLAMRGPIAPLLFLLLCQHVRAGSEDDDDDDATSGGGELIAGGWDM